MSNLYLVHWSGPHSYEDALKVRHNGLYLAHGRLALGREPSTYRPLYIGMAHRKRGIGGRLAQHDIREFNHENNSWWVGEVKTPADPGRDQLLAVEALFIYATQPERNIRCKDYKPKREVHVISHWWKPSGERRYKNDDAMAWVPDVISWDGEHMRVSDRLQKLPWER